MMKIYLYLFDISLSYVIEAKQWQCYIKRYSEFNIKTSQRNKNECSC